MQYNRYIFIGIIFFTGISCSPQETGEVVQDGFIEGYDGAELYYQVRGSAADSLIIIHGGPGAGMNSFLPSVKPLVKNFTLILYDQRGGGKSTLPEDTTKLKSKYFVEDLEAIRSHFGIKKMNVITHSFGSILLAEYALKYPDKLNRVVFHGSTGPIRSEMASYYQAKAQRTPAITDTALTNRATELLTALLNGTAEDPVSTCEEYESISRSIASKRGEQVNYKGSTCEAPPEAVKYYYKYTAQLAPAYFGSWDYTEKLNTFEAPLLVIYGAEDSLAIPSQQSWIDITPNSRLLLVPNAGKPSLADNPEFVLPAINRFFEGAWPEQVQ